MQKLHVLNYFDPTSLSPNVVPVDEDEIDLDITLSEKSSDRASANIGFTGIYGMTGGMNLEFNNFLGMGQILSLGFDIGTQIIKATQLKILEKVAVIKWLADLRLKKVIYLYLEIF